MLLFLVPAAAAADCLPTATWIDRAKLDIVAGATPEARASLDAALESMKCEVPTPPVVGDWFRTEGVVRALAGDVSGADRAFAAAKRIAPGPLDPRFGSELARQHDRASDTTSTTLEVDTNRAHVWVDTVHVERLPVDLATGDHLVEIRDWAGLGAWNTVVNVTDDLALDTGLPEIPRPKTSAELHPGRPWLIAAAASVVAGGAAFAGSYAMLPRVEHAASLESMHTSNTTMHALAYGGVGLGGAAVALFGVHLVVK